MIHKNFEVHANDFDQAGQISSLIKKWIKEQGLSSDLIRRIAIACYEAEMNMIIHSVGGHIFIDSDDQTLTITFLDQGPGIENIDLAMKAGWSTASTEAQSMGFGAGLGLVNIKKNADYFSLESSPQGTKLSIGFKLSGDDHETQ